MKALFVSAIVLVMASTLTSPAFARGGGGGGGHGGGGHACHGGGGGGGGHAGGSYGGYGYGHGGGRGYYGGGGGYYYDQPDPLQWGSDASNQWGNHQWGNTGFNGAMIQGYGGMQMPATHVVPPQLNSSLPAYIGSANASMVVQTYNWPKHADEPTITTEANGIVLPRN